MHAPLLLSACVPFVCMRRIIEVMSRTEFLFIFPISDSLVQLMSTQCIRFVLSTNCPLSIPLSLSPSIFIVPLFLSLSLDLFQLASVDVSSGTRLLVNSLVRDRYPISYIYGFHSRGFSYFLTVQKTQAEGQNPKPFISKLGKSTVPFFQ